MKKLLLILLFVHSLMAQSSITLSAQGPQSVSTISLTRVGNQGNSTYYYWVVANWTSGQSIATMQTITFAPDTLGASNYVIVNWNSVSGANSYDVLRTSTPTLVTCASCAVATGLTVNTVNDIGGALGAYTYAPVANVTASVVLNNSQYVNPTIIANRDLQFPVPLCVGAPGNTLGQFRSMCTTAAASVYVCTNSGGCTTAGQWTQITSGGGGSTWTVTPLGNITGATTLHVGNTQQIFTGTLTGNVTLTASDAGSASFMIAFNSGVGNFAITYDASFAGGGVLATDNNVNCYQSFAWVGTAGIARPQGDMTCPSGSPNIYTSAGKIILPTAPDTLAGLAANNTLTGTNTFNGVVDSRGATHTLPSKTGVTASLPATCTVGEEYFSSNATAGQNKYYCTAVNVWTQQTGGGGTAGCGISVSASVVSWNPINMYDCTGLWEDFLGGINTATTSQVGSVFPWTTASATGTWTMAQGDPTTYDNTVKQIGVAKITAPATLNPLVAFTPASKYAPLASTFITAKEWAIAEEFLTSDVTNGQWRYGWQNSSSQVPFAGNSGIYLQFIPGTNVNVTGYLCTSGVCDTVDFGVALTAAAWHSAIIKRDTTGVASPTVTMTFDGVTRTFCASGCTNTDAHAPVNTVKHWMYDSVGYAGTPGAGAVYWEFDAVALFYHNLGR